MPFVFAGETTDSSVSEGAGLTRLFRPSLQHGIQTTRDTPRNFGGKRYPLKELNNCPENGSIHFSHYGGSCASKVKIHPVAIDFLDKYLFHCAQKSLKDIGVKKKIRRVTIFTQGIYVKRKVKGKSVWSNHTTGSAIDMNQLGIEFSDGTQDYFPTSAVGFDGKIFEGFKRCRSNCHYTYTNPVTGQKKNRRRRYDRSGKAVFYDSIFKCFDEKIEKIKQEYLSKNNRKCTGGVKGCDQSKANANHIHMSVPICPRPPGFSPI